MNLVKVQVTPSRRLPGISAGNLNAPEAWNPLNYEGVSPSDGQHLVGITSDHGVLMIFKDDRVAV